MKRKGIFIDLRNKQHVAWWNNTARKLVKAVRYDTIVETATNKPVGVLIGIKGILAGYVEKQNLKFIKNPTTMILKTKE